MCHTYFIQLCSKALITNTENPKKQKAKICICFIFDEEHVCVFGVSEPKRQKK